MPDSPWRPANLGAAAPSSAGPIGGDDPTRRTARSPVAELHRGDTRRRPAFERAAAPQAVVTRVVTAGDRLQACAISVGAVMAATPGRVTWILTIDSASLTETAVRAGLPPMRGGG